MKHLWAVLMLVVAPAATADLMLQARQTVDIYGSSALSQRLADVDYQLTWQLTGQETEQGCLPAQVMVSLTATVNDPLHWPDTPAWQNYRLALLSYEREVRERALLSAQWLEQSLFRITPQESCAQLQKIADNIGYHQLKIAQTLLDDFQYEQDYGRRLGVNKPETPAS